VLEHGSPVGTTKGSGLEQDAAPNSSTMGTKRTLSWPEPRASAPLTISMISVVMESCRARFMIRLSDLISSSALSVAAFMARWRNACSDAAALSNAA